MKGTKRYRSELENKKVELMAAIRNREVIAVERAADEIDAMQLAAMREQAIIELDRESRLLREIVAALERIVDGSYGICEQCEEDVSPKRLKALPWARHCVGCQHAIDREALRAAA